MHGQQQLTGQEMRQKYVPVFCGFGPKIHRVEITSRSDETHAALTTVVLFLKCEASC
jgi:hypothetical protein